MQREAFSEEEGFEGGVKSGWISVGNRGESNPDLWANNIYRPAIRCFAIRWFDEGAPGYRSKLAPRRNMYSASKWQVCLCMTQERLENEWRDFVVNFLENA